MPLSCAMLYKDSNLQQNKFHYLFGNKVVKDVFFLEAGL